ncbi:MAG: ASCH domain-containing protein [Marinilabiliaceae bacterium]|nr:ASCH domain-containing protein [Marinilabiliaceae bacterium]
MKVLNLIIKREYFDLILAGKKTQEFREVKPTTEKKLVQIDDNGYVLTDEYNNTLPIEYDAIRFFVGYNKNRDSALVEVKSAHCEVFVDDDDNVITYPVVGKDGEVDEYEAEQVVYDLGRIIEKNIH